MKRNLLLAFSLALLLPACQTSTPVSESAHTSFAPTTPTARSATYLSPTETQRLKDLLPGPFPRRENATAEETKTLSTMLSAAEVEVIRAIQADTSAQDRARADHLEELDPWWNFDFVLGPHFNAKECPKIDAFMSTAEREVAAIKDSAKKKFARPRPPESNLTGNDSYPSGHSTRAYFRARILAEIAPDAKDRLIMEARSMMLNRMIAGKHHPADVVGGITLGTAIADSMIAAAKDPANPIHTDFEAAKQEWRELMSKRDQHPKSKPGA